MKSSHIDFDHMLLSIDPAEDIFITDTTFRDGQQARPPYTVKQIEAIFDCSTASRGPTESSASRFFLYTEKDREALELCLSKGYQYPGITGWIRAVEEDLQLVADCGRKETGILTSVFDYHIFLKLNHDRKTAMKKYHQHCTGGVDKGIAPGAILRTSHGPITTVSASPSP